MNALDYGIVVAYLLAMLALGAYFRDADDDEGDYFLGGREVGWLPVGLSVMATQLSAVSFISIPAFVGVREGGGLTFVSTELHAPLTALILMALFLPPLYRSGVISVYSFLERRVGPGARTAVSGVFLVNRALATGTALNAVALVLEATMGIGFAASMLAIGLVTVVYAWQGGMRAVLYGDAVQLVILLLGITACVVYGLDALGGLGAWREQLDAARLVAVDADAIGIGGDGEFGLWPLLIGGTFISVAYYGTDQSEAQRMLSSADLPALRRSLVFVGLVRYPVIALYAFAGLVVGPLMLARPGMATRLASEPDAMIPAFIIAYLPHGLIGVLVVAIIAAAMSSLSSAVNSLSAVTIEDYVRPRRSARGRGGSLVAASRFASLGWGGVIIAAAFGASYLDETLAVIIPMIGSLSFGPILALFVGAIVTSRLRSRYGVAALLAGVGLNVYLWLGVGDRIFWIWWNVTGFLTTIGLAAIAVWLAPQAPVVRASAPVDLRPDWSAFRGWEAPVLLAWFAAMLGLSYAWPYLLG